METKLIKVEVAEHIVRRDWARRKWTRGDQIPNKFQVRRRSGKERPIDRAGEPRQRRRTRISRDH